ncbi:MAG: GGDEF domain-containing protein, partial [Desulfobulbaceae bacterium]|nr:GGDEF domain-containing protein [Desulfobulbaceae bacterium]
VESVNRSSDLVARYGGDEFVALLPEIGKTGALGIAENMNRNVQALNIAHGYSEVSNTVTISVGTASAVPSIDETPTVLLDKADRQLYRAKALGRNRVCSNTPEGT